MQTSPLGDYHHLNTFEIAPLPSFSLPCSLVTLSSSLILHPDYPASLISWIKVFLRSVRVRTQVNEYARDSHKHWFAFAQVLSKIHYPQIRRWRRRVSTKKNSFGTLHFSHQIRLDKTVILNTFVRLWPNNSITWIIPWTETRLCDVHAQKWAFILRAQSQPSQ